MSGGSVWIQIEVLPIRLRVLLPMLMKEGLKTAADETGNVPMEGTWRLLPMEQGLCQ
jgi:hypothetical protein